MRSLLEDYIPSISRAVFAKVHLNDDGHLLTPRGLHVQYNKEKAAGYMERATKSRWDMLSRVSSSTKLASAMQKQRCNLTDNERASQTAENVLSTFGRANKAKPGQRPKFGHCAGQNSRMTSSDATELMNGFCGKGHGGAEEADMLSTATVGASLM